MINGNLCGSGAVGGGGSVTQGTSPWVVSVSTVDPCLSSAVLKATAPVTVATAATTQIVAPSGTKAVYICGGSFSIAPSATSAATALIEYGASSNCTGTHALTGAFGAGDLTTAAPPIVVNLTGELVGPSCRGGGVLRHDGRNDCQRSRLPGEGGSPTSAINGEGGGRLPPSLRKAKAPSPPIC